MNEIHACRLSECKQLHGVNKSVLEVGSVNKGLFSSESQICE